MQFLDVVRYGSQLVVVAQADMLRHLTTRFVIPLQPVSVFDGTKSSLNPRFMVDDEEMVLLTEFASAVRSRELGSTIASLANSREKIVGAIDLLVTGV
jgi:toxin CcdB